MGDSNPLPPLPQSMEEAEVLVERLYRPGPAKIMSQLSDQLIRLQHSSDGWNLADYFMKSQNGNVRFHGANTFTLKLNNEGPSLDEQIAETVQARIIYWVVRLVQQGEKAMVCKKLCAAMTAYFIRSSVPWERPLLHVALSFIQGEPVPYHQVEASPIPMIDLLPRLNDNQRQMLLWFAGILVEQVREVDNTNPSCARLHAQTANMATDVHAIIKWSLQAQNEGGVSSARTPALQCFSTWVNYAQPLWSHLPDKMMLLRSLIQPAAQCLLDQTLNLDALDIFQDLLESYMSFFEAEHFNLLRDIISRSLGPRLVAALTTQDPDSVVLGKFMVAFGSATIQQIVEHPDDELGSTMILQLYFSMLAAESFPGDDDQLSIHCIEFWNTYIEYVNDENFSSDADSKPQWLPYAKSVMSKAVDMHCKKMWYPAEDIKETWTDDETAGFKEFRQDALDLMTSAFVLLEETMLKQLVALTLPLVDAQEWRGVEAALFCINALADQVLEYPQYCEIVGQIFRSNLFRLVADFSLDMPLVTRGIAIKVLGNYGQYIEQHAEFLPDSLRLLFTSLEAPDLKNAAAKAIESLCSACRNNLTGELDGFLTQYQRFLRSKTSDPYTKEKVMGGIAMIVQALTPESAKVPPLIALLANVESDVEGAKQYAAAGDQAKADEMGVSALTCLASIGRGMQAPEEGPIDVDDDEPSTSLESSFWGGPDGQAVQQRITNCFFVLQVVGNSSQAVDAACEVLKSGYPERQPGPFVLPPIVTVRFLEQCSVKTPRLERVIEIVRILIAQHSRPNTRQIDDEVKAIYDHVALLLQTLGTSNDDPSIATSSFELMKKMMERYAHVLFENIEPSTLDFTLTTFATQETFPKREASDFWTKTIALGAKTGSQEVKEKIHRIMTVYGPKLASALIRQLNGVALREDFRFLCHPFIALLTSIPGGQKLLEQKLMSDELSAPHVSAEKRRTFLRHVLAVRRDSKKMKEVLEAFWAECKGTVASYSRAS